MKKFYSLSLIILLSSLSLLAQQLPNSGFEDWSGTQFNGNIQLASWQSSNVEQTYMGITARANMITRVAGHSGQYAAYVKNTKVEVAGIGEVSPAWITLGTPFSDITNGISGATAGTYGGINWTYCPDTMQVWIKRTFGSDSQDEIFSLVYYSWKGTSKASSYKAKNGSCVTIAEKINEESDIRQTNDPNGCGTSQYATQVGEGWYHEKAGYNQWTLIRVPITYFSDETPEKVNVILSGGNYPNFRANNGIYEGNGIYVDDLSLIYSSCAHEMYIGNKLYRGFSAGQTTYTYSLGQGVTTVPSVFVKRSGRRLPSSEVTIVDGQVDGAPTTITITAQDGSSTTTYTVYFVSATSNNARLADIQIDGQSLSGFNAYLTSYQYALPYGTTQAPVITATAQDGGATVSITQPTSPNGTATIVVTAQDGTTRQTYQVQLSVAQLSDNTLSNILVDGTPLAGFSPSKSNYTVSLPLGTTAAPAITPVSAYPAGAQTITMSANSLTDGCQITVSAPGAASPKTYRLTYRIEASSYSYLAGIALDGVALDGFVPSLTSYSLSLPLGTTEAPAISWTPGDAYQTVTLTEGGIGGVSRITVTAASGAQTVYKIAFSVQQSSCATLSGLLLDGEALASFHPDTLSYRISLPVGTASAPVVTAVPGDSYQTVAISAGGLSGVTRITVRAQDGTVRLYTIRYDVQKSENALLRMIYLDGDSLPGFSAETLTYTVLLSSATAPQVTVLKEAGQSVSISQPAGEGTAFIVVTPEEGEPGTYRVLFTSTSAPVCPTLPSDSLQPSHSALLADILLDGQSLPLFSPSRFAYTDSLAWRTLTVPSIMPVAATKGQTITVAYGALDGTTRIHVVAEDGVTEAEYTIAFPVRRSSNAALADLIIDGVDFLFSPDSTDYHITLPYGTHTLPAITAEKAGDEQQIDITTRGIADETTIVVTAEDGTERTYRLHLEVALSTLPNSLQAIAVDGYGLIDLTETTDTDFVISLPYGSTCPQVVSYTRSFAEQSVVVEQGGADHTTRVSVFSGRPDEAARVYTIRASVPAHDPAYLTDLQIDGATIEGFSPDRYHYVVSVSARPAVSFSLSDGSDADVLTENIKQTVISVENGEYSHTYTVSFFYPADFTFSQSFETWSDYTNSGASNGNVGEVPTGWHTPLNATISGDKSSYYPADAVYSSPNAAEGSKSAMLATTYLLTSAEAMPGILSLSSQTLSVGGYYIVKHTASSLSFGDPITFRNTPDRISLDYNALAANRVTGWHFIYKRNGAQAFDYTGSFAVKNSWKTVSQDLTYADGFVPASLDIIIASAQSLNLSDYYVGADGAQTSKRYTSQLLVDNLRFYYSSALSGVLVNGAEATISGTDIAATVAADYEGTPSLGIVGEVSDQGHQVEWQPWSGRTRTATITSIAEDGSTTAYTLTLTRPVSTTTAITCTLQDADLIIARQSPYQTVSVSLTDTAYVVRVVAESGDEQTYIVPVSAWAAGAEEQHTTIEAAMPAAVPSTGRLSDIAVDEVTLPSFDPETLDYSASAGIYSAARQCPADSLTMLLTDSLVRWTVFADDLSSNVYTLRLPLMSDAHLLSITLDGAAIEGFSADSLFYPLSVTAPVIPTPVLSDETQTVTTFTLTEGDTYTYFYIVRAEDGTSLTYCVQETVRQLDGCTSLADLRLGGESVPGFTPSVYDYTLQKPAGYQMPDVTAVVAGVNAQAVVTSSTLFATGASVTSVVILVTAESGATATYTLTVEVLPSSVCNLEMIYLDAAELTGFSSDSLTYSITLPVGTTALPAVDYLKAEEAMTVSEESAAIADQEGTVRLVCTAEDGTERIYTLHFTVLLSDDAHLRMIYTDGEALASFDEDILSYTVALPYGAAYPAVSGVTADSAATAVLDASSTGDSVLITVTAANGEATLTYTVRFTILPSDDAALSMLYLDGDSLPGFMADEEDYTIQLPYGTTTLPVLTYLTGDEQQTVTVEGTNPLTVTVTAGDGETTQEYHITFTFALSDCCTLSDLRLSGRTVSGFSRDSLTYLITYPVGSTEADFFTAADVVAVPDDADATVSVSMEPDGTLTIMVTAPSGAVRVYVVEQTITLSSCSLLRMIWLDDAEVRDFDPATYTYSYLLPQGAIAPAISAEALDTLAEVFITPAMVGDTSFIYCVAEDGSETVYRVVMLYSDVNSADDADIDDCIFLHIVGSDQYMAITIRQNVQVMVCDHYGQRLYLADVPVVDPNYVRVEETSDGNQYIAEVYDGANGALFTVPNFDNTYFAVFFRNGKRKVAKGTKFSLSY